MKLLRPLIPKTACNVVAGFRNGRPAGRGVRARRAVRAVPAVAAIPAVPGPADMRFLALASWRLVEAPAEAQIAVWRCRRHVHQQPRTQPRRARAAIFLETHQDPDKAPSDGHPLDSLNIQEFNDH